MILFLKDEFCYCFYAGLDYMERAAHAGERSAMVYMARAYDTGLNLANPEADRSISRALFWYEEIQVQATPIIILLRNQSVQPTTQLVMIFTLLAGL